ncbi:c-type cytochrome [Polaromonas sp.]|uniref:c-type cytochrome n=1 Tax=Polaromonas sp. TaxID=1869339 RepID=UPI0013BC20D7|nr:c-type cytochrome [Polaromonas sp.]NDP62427.1 cytochrome c5 family protein [Polaromonas sp.]
MHKPLNVLAIAALAFFLTACGDKNQATPAASAPAPVAAPAPAPAAPVAVADNAVGKSTFNNTCALCHASGAAGAPKTGDKADWGPRIAQGKDTLYKHALEGFNGAKGAMPARGGSTTLSDDQVKAAVDYMVGLAS